MLVMPFYGIDYRVIYFQCPKRGNDLQHTNKVSTKIDIEELTTRPTHVYNLYKEGYYIDMTACQPVSLNMLAGLLDQNEPDKVTDLPSYGCLQA